MQLTARNADLQDLAALLQEQHARKLDIVAPATAIRASGGRLIINGAGTPTPDPEHGVVEGPGTFVPTAICDEGLSDKLRIPITYLRRIREERVDLWDENVNGWLHGASTRMHVEERDGGAAAVRDDADPRKFLVRCYRGEDDDNGIARAFLSDGFGIIDNLDVLTAALEGIRDSGAEVQVVGCDLSDRRMHLKIAAPAVAALAPTLLAGYRSPFDQNGGPQRAGGGGGWTLESGRAAAAREGHGYEPGKEPIVFAGFVVSNSEVGDGAFTITPRILVKVCGNGLVIPVDALRRVHLGTKMEAGVIRWSHDTVQKNLALVTAQARDAVTTFLDPEYVKATITRLEEKAGAPITRPKEQIEVVGKQLGFPPERVDAILNHFILGGQPTAGGLMNAVTSYAQTIQDPDDANGVEALGVRALELAAALR